MDSFEVEDRVNEIIETSIKNAEDAFVDAQELKSLLKSKKRRDDVK